ncbi:Protein of unknown function DUF4270 [Flavobacteriaceae bacterium]|jgi:hypothetical protein
MLKNSFFKTIPFLLFIVLFNSCDKEFNVIGEDLIGNNSFDITKEEFPVLAYNQKLGPIQSNNLEVNALGIYENPSFGTTTANFNTQIILATPGTTIDKSAVISTVVLTVPYFTDKTKTKLDNTTGVTTYELDSIFGPEKAKMKLSIYESGYYMRDLDPAEQFLKAQKFYNDQYNDFNGAKIGSALNNDPSTAQNIAFFFDPAEHVNVTKVDDKDVTTRTAPGMQLNLNKDFFQEKLFGSLGAAAGSLATNEIFKNYFRGLFFNIEATGGNSGNLAMIDFTKGKITINYKETIDSKTVDKTMILELKGNTVSLLDESNSNSKYTNATNESNVDKVNGDPNLYLKGGAGSLSIIELFGSIDKYGDDGVSGAPNTVPDKLDIMRSNKYLINEANLVFHLNASEMGASYVPQRIYLYDYTNNQVLSDYYESTIVSNTKYNKYIFGGILSKGTTENGNDSYYKFRITNHIRNLVKFKDSTNVKIGLVVTENINKSSFYALKDKNGKPLFAPSASVMSPLGVILFGNNLPVDDKKRLKFEIYYTKPN